MRRFFTSLWTRDGLSGSWFRYGTMVYFKEPATKSSAGFTLVEILISVSIVTLISTIVMFSYRAFEDNLALSSAVQEMVISVRQAQTYGLSVRQASVGGGDFTAGYGVEFDMDNPSLYYIFVDNNHDGVCGSNSTLCSSSSERVEKESLSNGVTVTAICGTPLGGSEICPPEASVRMMAVTFVRPNPDAILNFTNNGNVITAGPLESGRIELTSQQGKKKSILIERTGQISIQ